MCAYSTLSHPLLPAGSRQAGHRFGEYLERVMPLIVQYVAVDDDELREYCISACEAFTLRCPKEITHHLPTVSSLLLGVMMGECRDELKSLLLV